MTFLASELLQILFKLLLLPHAAPLMLINSDLLLVFFEVIYGIALLQFLFSDFIILIDLAFLLPFHQSSQLNLHSLIKWQEGLILDFLVNRRLTVRLSDLGAFLFSP